MYIQFWQVQQRQRIILNELPKEILSGKVSRDAVVEDGAVKFENVEIPTV